MKAIILNAGKGGRLAPHTDSLPKCLIEMGGKTLLDHQLASLRAVGIRDIVLVLGYRREQIIDHLTRYSDLSFTFIENHDFGTTNTAYSLWLARHEMSDDFVYFNGDVLFHPEILRRLTAATAPNALAVERKSCGDEEVKVVLRGTEIVSVGKEIPNESSYGEFIGIARFSRTIGPLFSKTLEQLIEGEGRRNDYFESALERMIPLAQLTAVDITDLPCIEIDFPEDLERARAVTLPLLAGNGSKRRRKVLFYAERNLHIPFLEPIHDILREDPEVEVAFSSPPYQPAVNGRTGWGLPQQEIERLRSKSRHVARVEEFAPDATVVADVCSTLGPCGRLVNVGHGIISKGYFYTDKPVVRRENIADLICVPGPWHKEILGKNVFSPIKVTGFIKSDRLFGPNACTREDFCRLHGIPEGRRIILFAPTFNPELSAIPCVGERIAELCEQDTTLLIKLHGMTDSCWVDLYRDLASRNDNIIFIDDIDLSPAMAAADVMVSDVSSAFVEFLFLNRPVVLFDNPRQKEYHNYDPGDIEYLVRDACLTVGSVEELKLAVRLSFAAPQELEAKRMRYAEALCYGRDGKSAHRAAQAVTQLLDGAFDRQSDGSRYLMILMWDQPPSFEELSSAVKDIGMKNDGISMEIICVGPRPIKTNYQESGVTNWIDCPRVDGAALQKALSTGIGDFLVFVKGGFVLPDKWLRRLADHFRWFPETGGVEALSTIFDFKAVYRNVFAGKEPTDHASAAQDFYRALIGTDLPIGVVPGKCLLVKRASLSHFSFPHGANDSDFFGAMGNWLREGGATLRLAPDIFAYPSERIGTQPPKTPPTPYPGISMPAAEAAASRAAILVKQGNEEAQQGKHSKAASLFHEALMINPREQEALIGLGVVNLVSGSFHEAEGYFIQALGSLPGNAKALCGLGMVKSALGRGDDAFRCFSKALDSDPENLTALFELVKCAYTLERYGEAERHLGNYLRYHPADLNMIFSHAGVLLKMDKRDEAREKLETILLFDPGFEGALEMLQMIGGQLPIAV